MEAIVKRTTSQTVSSFYLWVCRLRDAYYDDWALNCLYIYIFLHSHPLIIVLLSSSKLSFKEFNVLLSFHSYFTRALPLLCKLKSVIERDVAYAKFELKLCHQSSEVIFETEMKLLKFLEMRRIPRGWWCLKQLFT